MCGCGTSTPSRETPVTLVPSFAELLQPLSVAMTCPTFGSILTLVAGWAFARRRTNITLKGFQP